MDIHRYIRVNGGYNRITSMDIKFEKEPMFSYFDILHIPTHSYISFNILWNHLPDGISNENFDKPSRRGEWKSIILRLPAGVLPGRVSYRAWISCHVTSH